MNGTGRIQIVLPRMGKYSVNNQSLYWVRVRIKDISAAEEREGMRPYQVSPRLRQLTIASWGGTIDATHAQVIRDEFRGPQRRFARTAFPAAANPHFGPPAG
jgi:hypothetical protein